MGLFRRRFDDLVSRQLDLFAVDSQAELAALADAIRAHRAADHDEVEATYGDLQDRVDWAAQDLIALRDAYAAGLEDETAVAYRRAYVRGVRRRYGALANAVESGDVD